MTDIPLKAREELADRFILSPLQVQAKQSTEDGVLKLLVHNGDGQGFECVLLPYRDRVSCCISSQVGCALGCEFCATGLGGFERNLTAGEILGQFLLLQKDSRRRISHLSLMGMGEPLHNYEAVVASLRLFHEEVGISYRRMTLSTVGIVPQIYRLAQEGLPINLAVSLHSPFDEVRSSLMPVNRRWPVAELIEASRRYAETTGRKLTFEYLLIDRVTDTPEQAVALAKLIAGIPCYVNLIPFNFVATRQELRRPSRTRIRAFRSCLETHNVSVSQRMELGRDIAAACGQLRGRHDGKLDIRRRLSTAYDIS